MMEMSPCKGCTDRHTACHDSCDAYKEWRDRQHAQQKHLDANRYRMMIPMSPARERTNRTYLKFGAGGHKVGGNQ